MPAALSLALLPFVLLSLGCVVVCPAVVCTIRITPASLRGVM